MAYKLTRAEVLHKATGRTNDFREDPLIPTGSAALADYRGSGFDRGHLAPAGDTHWSRRVMSESFLRANMSPPRPGVNGGLGKRREAVGRLGKSDLAMSVANPLSATHMRSSTPSGSWTMWLRGPPAPHRTTSPARTSTVSVPPSDCSSVPESTRPQNSVSARGEQYRKAGPHRSRPTRQTAKRVASASTGTMASRFSGISRGCSAFMCLRSDIMS
ncbi:MAG: DNA/RNA non-specific endonuclease [Armatimonadota bacterium]